VPLGLAILLAALVVGALAFIAAVWFYGWDVERYVEPRRAALIEAGERTADLVATFRDWLRLGR
jgi:hypothetical protein